MCTQGKGTSVHLTSLSASLRSTWRWSRVDRSLLPIMKTLLSRHEARRIWTNRRVHSSTASGGRGTVPSTAAFNSARTRASTCVGSMDQ